MANKREFKKFAAALGAGVAEDIMINYYANPGIDSAVADNCVRKVLMAAEKAIKNSNVFFDKGPSAFENREDYTRAHSEFFKALFKKINSDLLTEIEEAVKEFNAAVPAEVKARNKETLN